MKPDACKGCPLYDNGSNFVEPDCPQDKNLILWGEAPGAEEDKVGVGFWGASGRLLRGIASRCGLDVFVPKRGTRPPRNLQQSAAFRNIVLCRPKGNKYPGDEIALECMRRHQPWALDGPPIEDVPQIALGKNAIEGLTGFAPSGITDIRGTYLPTRNGGWCVGTIHPAFVVRGGGEDNPNKKPGQGQSSHYPLLMLDVRRALQQREPLVPRVQVYHDPHEVLAAWEEYRSGQDPSVRPKVAIDIEGTAEDPHVIGLCWKHGEAHVIAVSIQNREAAVCVLSAVLETGLPIYHNAAYDVPELEGMGVAHPPQWIDTINTAALLNPDSRKGLEQQVLTYVPGSITWKGLIDHNKGPDGLTPKVRWYRGLWETVLKRLNRGVPKTGSEWYWFYNGLDTAWTYALATEHASALGSEGRKAYYVGLMQPLQEPLLRMGQRGLPVDVERMAFHREGCERLERMAKRTLDKASRVFFRGELIEACREYGRLFLERKQFYDEHGRIKWEHTPLLAKARKRMRDAADKCKAGFNADSPPQRKFLLYEYLGLPPVTKKNHKNKMVVTTDDDAIESLLKRLERRDEEGETASPIKPTNATVEETIKILRALEACKKWATWRRNFLTPDGLKETGPGTRPRLPTQYSQHRSAASRLASGTDDTEGEKKRKVSQLQNVPRKLRDTVSADPGHVLIGADWAGIEWALAIWEASKLPRDFVLGWKPIDKPDNTFYKHNLPRVKDRILGGFYQDLLEKFFRGEFDPHRYLASHAQNKSEEHITGSERKQAKPYTHGYNYDGSPRTLARNARQTDKVGLKVCSAHDRAFMMRVWKDWLIAKTKRQRYVQTPMGWRRYFWDLNPKPTEILATEIQATAADMMKTIILEAARNAPSWFELLTSTHDSILGQVPLEKEEEGKQYMKSLMEQPFPWLDGRCWRADVKSGQTWRDVS